MTLRWAAISFAVIGLAAPGCASSFKVKGEPVGADVFVLTGKNGEKKSLGKTPLEMPQAALKQALGESVATGEFFTVGVEKAGFITEKYTVPASRFGTLVTELDVKLKSGDNPREARAASDLLNHLFLAQKLANAKEFERAQAELDRILTEFPDFPRALSMRGSIYFVQKNLAESAKWYEKATQADPQMEDAVKMLAKIRELDGGRTPAAASTAAAGAPGGKK
jgi:tetratricopeptide (TPR) repeat protein